MGVELDEHAAGQGIGARRPYPGLPRQVLDDATGHAGIAVQTAHGDPCLASGTNALMHGARTDRTGGLSRARDPTARGKALRHRIQRAHGGEDPFRVDERGVEANEDIAGERIGLRAAHAGQTPERALQPPGLVTSPRGQTDAHPPGERMQHTGFLGNGGAHPILGPFSRQRWSRRCSHVR